MKLREIIVKNFRNLADVSIPIEDTTVLVGENNSGKTALLDALRIALTRTSTSSETLFDEYDYHMCEEGDSPQKCEGIVIELWFREDLSAEWPDSLIQALSEIIQMDPIKDLNSIGLRLSSKFDEDAKEMVTQWQFLTLNGLPLGGGGARSTNLTRFSSYIRLFYLSALRDSNDEFSPRSRYWGRILRDLEIGEEQRKTIRDEIAKLNDDLLKADPKLERVRASLDKAQTILSPETEQSTSIQALPLKPWDLMSRSEVVVKARGSNIDFPLSRHGQGLQSLAVLFLFQAYIDVLLKPTFESETEAILTLEEPESHLHPQAIRALAANLSEIKGQKIISSHSPYFIQEIPFTQIRMFRRNGPSSKVLYIKRSFSVSVPDVAKLSEFCRKHPKFDYNESTTTLSVNGKMEDGERRELLIAYSKERDMHPQLEQLYEESQLYLSEDELIDLETYTKRIRGEVFFARAWLLCEGQSEYLLLRYFAKLLGKPLDHMGITVIDFQNNGSPCPFISLAKTFEIPWIMVCDNDTGGKDFVQRVKDRGLINGETSELARLLPGEGVDLEMFLFKSGFAEEYKSILIDLARSTKKHATEWIIARDSGEPGETRQVILKENEELEIRIFEKGHGSRTISQSDPDFLAHFDDIAVAELRQDKVGNANALIRKLQDANVDDATRVPEFIANIIEDIVEKASEYE